MARKKTKPKPKPNPKIDYTNSSWGDGVVYNFQPIWYAVSLGAMAVLHLLLWVWAVFVWGENLYEGVGQQVVPFTLSGVHILLSIRWVRVDQWGCVEFYGKPVMLAGRGLIIIPLFFLQLIKLPQAVVQDQFPGDPEKVFYGHNDADAGGKLRPIRILTADPTEEEETKAENNDPLAITALHVIIFFFTRYRILEPFVFRIRIGSLEEATRQLRDTGQQVLVREISRRSPKQVRSEVNQISKALKREIAKLILSWGVILDDAASLEPDFGDKVGTALAGIATAAGTRASTILEAQGQRQAEYEPRAGIAEGMSAIAASSQENGGDAAVALEAAKRIGENADTIVLGESGLTQFATVAKSLQAVLGATTKKKEGDE